MTRWYLIVAAALAAMLGAGCEHFKSPDRIHELEGRVNELSAEVSALAGKPVGGKAKPAGKPGEHGAEAGHDGSGEAPHGEGADKDKDKAKGDKDGDKDKDAKGESGGEGHAVEGETHGSQEDPAVARLKALVAKKPDEHKVVHWSYEGREGPTQWGTLDPAWSVCQKGIAQSPVDIEPKAGNANPIAFRYKPTAAAVIDNGHTLQVNLAPGSSIEIDDRSYELVQFHFHTPSEHTIAGEHYPLELHLVHKSAGGKFAVVGVMYDAGADSKSLGAVWSRWPKKPGVEDKLRKPFDPSTLLPETRTVFRYPGSLTTPPCTEGVVWNVMRRSMTDGKANLDAFGRHYPNNAREVQALNDRKIE